MKAVYYEYGECNSCERNLKAGEADVCYKCSIKLMQQLKADAPLMSEALMYAEFHRTKTLLYNRFGSLNILQHSADRRTTENRTDLMAICCDIVDDLFKLEESNISVLCGAANWKRFPKMNPEEITNVSMADKLAQFEAKLAQYDIAIADVKRTNFAIDARVSNMENSRNAEWPNIISTVVPDKNGKRVTRDDNPFTPLILNLVVLPETVPGTWSTNDMLGLVMIDAMIQLVTTAMVDEEIIDVMVRIVMVEEQELGHHVVDLHMEEVENQDVDIYMVE